MPKVVYCPFYKFHKGNKIYCENGVKVFDKHEGILEYLRDFCGDAFGHHDCECAAELYAIYEGSYMYEYEYEECRQG